MNLEGARMTGSSHSQLFTVRVWYEDRSPGVLELRIQVKHVLTGETQYFREWLACNAFMARRFDVPPALNLEQRY